MTDEKTFHLGIAMAGAISAGTYTAGVMDYLFEVLGKWEDMKKDAAFDDVLPKHNVVVEVLGGASAGGMTACITALAVQRHLRPIAAYSPQQKKSYDEAVSSDELADRKKENRLYNSWVNLTADDMIPQMLETDDLAAVSGADQKTFISALNSKFIKQIANHTLTVKDRDKPLDFPPYVSKSLRAFVTLTNLEGFKREIKFAGAGGSGFFMYDHRDAAMFSFDHKETIPFDGCIDVDFLKPTNTELFVNAGMATGAFPVGLAYRTFSRPRKYIENSILLARLNGGNKVRLDEDDVLHGDYRATLIDGGTIDNEPFDLTRYLLETRVRAAGDTFRSATFGTFNSTVLMIDPFPSEDRPRILYDPDRSPFSVLGAAAKLFGNIREQSMFKADDVKKAISTNDCSRFLISPRRRVRNDKPVDGSGAIACGVLGGFGGFLDKDFRKHDFYLGRINCKAFLQKHFVISEHAAERNPTFAVSYKDTVENRKIRETFGYDSIDPVSGIAKKVFPIIPDVNLINDRKSGIDVNDLYFDLKFPSYSREQLRAKIRNYDNGIKERLKMMVLSNVLPYSPMRLILRAALVIFGRKAVSQVAAYIAAELERWKILR